MKAKDEVYDLMNEFASLTAQEQEIEFKLKMDTLLNGKTDEERKEFSKAMIEGARNTMKEADELIAICEIKEALKDIYVTVNWSDIAEHYFGKSRCWMSQRINGSKVNNKIASFTDEEKIQLKNALFDLSERIKNTAQQL